MVGKSKLANWSAFPLLGGYGRGDAALAERERGELPLVAESVLPGRPRDGAPVGGLKGPGVSGSGEITCTGDKRMGQKGMPGDGVYMKFLLRVGARVGGRIGAHPIPRRADGGQS